MSNTFPLYGPIGVDKGANSDGVLIGKAPSRVPDAILWLKHFFPANKVLKGDMSSGIMSYTDVTTSANDDTDDDVELFNATSFGEDRFIIEVEDKNVSSVVFDVSTAGVGTGLWVCTAEYWDGSNFQEVPSSNDNGSGFTSIGLKTVSFDLSSVNLKLLPVAGSTGYFLFFKLTGVSTMTTAPRIKRLYVQVPVGYGKYVNVTNMYGGQGFYGPFNRSSKYQVWNLTTADDKFIWLNSNKFHSLNLMLLHPLAGYSGLTYEYSKNQNFNSLPVYKDDSNLLTYDESNYNYDEYDIQKTSATGWNDTLTIDQSFLITDNMYVEAKIVDPLSEVIISLTDNPGNLGDGLIQLKTLSGMANYSVAHVIQESNVLGPITANSILRLVKIGKKVTFVLETPEGIVQSYEVPDEITVDCQVDVDIYVSAHTVDDLRILKNGQNLALTFTDTGSGYTEISSTPSEKNRKPCDIKFIPPSDWDKMTIVDDESITHEGYVMSISMGTYIYTDYPNFVCDILPLGGTDVEGFVFAATYNVVKMFFMAQVLSGLTQNSKFLLVNKNSEEVKELEWVAGEGIQNISETIQFATNNELLFIQIQEEGTTEFDQVVFMTS